MNLIPKDMQTNEVYLTTFYINSLKDWMYLYSTLEILLSEPQITFTDSQTTQGEWAKMHPDST